MSEPDKGAPMGDEASGGLHSGFANSSQRSGLLNNDFIVIRQIIDHSSCTDDWFSKHDLIIAEIVVIFIVSHNEPRSRRFWYNFWYSAKRNHIVVTGTFIGFRNHQYGLTPGKRHLISSR
jgi:hypothetical protein